jgi:hypothetical protein
MQPAKSHLINLRLTLHHLKQLIIVIPRIPHPLYHLLSLMRILRQPLERFTKKHPPVRRPFAYLGAGKC